MKKRYKFLILILFSGYCLLSACGQKGDLFLLPEKPESAESSNQ